EKAELRHYRLLPNHLGSDEILTGRLSTPLFEVPICLLCGGRKLGLCRGCEAGQNERNCNHYPHVKPPIAEPGA
ncbi:MAG: hypothetical protein NTV97_15085, partial [Alphaproteobacteria bacterium]|nr:hypothetical protein [Alphaproteobacteria bacterium]